MEAISLLKKIGQIILLVLLQVLLLNKINLFGYVTPMLYIWITIKAANNISQSGLLL